MKYSPSILHGARRVGLTSLLLASALVAGCAAVQPSTPELAVKQRATERWKLLVSGEIKRAYEYTAPSYRAITSYDTYSKGMGSVATWVGAEVLKVECETPEKCTARVKIEAKPLVNVRYKGTITSGVDETWLLEGGQWWLFQKL
jgi:Tfp pilus assembly protein PilP